MRVAIEKGYISPRSAPPGEALKLWVVSNNAPQWACRAAFDYLIDNKWRPDDEKGKAIAARYLILNDYTVTNELAECIEPWLSLARQASQTET